MDDNWRTAIGYICIASVFITYFLFMGWIMSPQEFTFKVEMDNNTKEAFESIDYEAMINAPSQDNKIFTNESLDRYYQYMNGDIYMHESYNNLTLAQKKSQACHNVHVEDWIIYKWYGCGMTFEDAFVATGETEDKK